QQPGGVAVVAPTAVGGLVDQRRGDPQAEGGQQLAQVVAVGVVVALAEHDEAATAGHVVDDGVDLGGGEHRREVAGDALAGRGGGVGDDEDVGVGQRVRRELAFGVGVD